MIVLEASESSAIGDGFRGVRNPVIVRRQVDRLPANAGHVVQLEGVANGEQGHGNGLQLVAQFGSRLFRANRHVDQGRRRFPPVRLGCWQPGCVGVDPERAIRINHQVPAGLFPGKTARMVFAEGLV